jgi:hypothetical protein
MSTGIRLDRCGGGSDGAPVSRGRMGGWAQVGGVGWSASERVGWGTGGQVDMSGGAPTGGVGWASIGGWICRVGHRQASAKVGWGGGWWVARSGGVLMGRRAVARSG